MTPKDLALQRAPEAIIWCTAANRALNEIIGFNGERSQIANRTQFKAQKTHFHVELGPPPSHLRRFLSFLPFTSFGDPDDPTLQLLKVIRFRFWDIMSALSRASSIFVDAPAGGGEEHVGMAPAFTPRNRDGTLRITPYYDSVGDLVKVHCLVHEAAHFVSQSCQDFAYRDRTGEPDQFAYINLDVQHAIENADSYAYFALQMAKGIDRVIEGDE